MRRIFCIIAAALAVLPAVAQGAGTGFSLASEETLAKIARFKEHDPFGISMAIIAMGVVFIALIILFLCFKWSGKLLNKKKGKPTSPQPSRRGTGASGVSPISKSRPLEKGRGTTVLAPAGEAPGEASDASEIAAAIAMALFLAEDGMHDSESDTLTLVAAEQAWTGHGANQKQDPVRRW